ncbi:MAG: hypothetical protein ACYDBV_12740 [Nitrospiria bacterium]
MKHIVCVSPDDDTKYVCGICRYETFIKSELEEKECGGLSPLGIAVGDKAPQKYRFNPPSEK